MDIKTKWIFSRSFSHAYRMAYTPRRYLESDRPSAETSAALSGLLSAVFQMVQWCAAQHESNSIVNSYFLPIRMNASRKAFHEHYRGGEGLFLSPHPRTVQYASMSDCTTPMWQLAWTGAYIVKIYLTVIWSPPDLVLRAMSVQRAESIVTG